MKVGKVNAWTVACWALLGLATAASAQEIVGGDPNASSSSSGASEEANRMADEMMYKPITYANAGKPGPQIVVLPGDVKSMNASFTQKVGANNIADFAELELSKANFTVLERSNLGPLLNEVALAYNMGDQAQARKILQKGRLKSTKWFVKFDILKAEPVAQASSGFDGRAIGGLLSIFGGNRNAAGVGHAVGSVQTGESAGIWLVGMRYKILDANTTEQRAQGYFEQKMEMGAKSSSFLGISTGTSGGATLDTLVQRLVQQSVSEIDAKYK